MGNQNNMVLDLMDLIKLFSFKFNIINRLYESIKRTEKKKFNLTKTTFVRISKIYYLNILILGIFCLTWAIISHLFTTNQKTRLLQVF